MVKPDNSVLVSRLPLWRGPGPCSMFDVAALAGPPVSHQFYLQLFLFRLCDQCQYFPPPIKSWINLRSRGRQVVTTTCSAEGGVGQPANPRDWRWGQTLHSSSDRILTLVYFSPADEKYSPAWSHSPHSPQQPSVCLRLSAHLPPSPLSSPDCQDCQVATEEDEEDFYHEDSALVIKEEAGPEAGAVLSFPEPAFSTPCESNQKCLLTSVLILKFYSQLAKLLLWSEMDFY